MTIEIARTFKTADEIRALAGFVLDHPVSTDNYKELVGDYRFKEKLVCCVLKKSGSLCRTPHNYGFVVRLKDGSVSIIGNHCAVKNFDAKDLINKDRSRFLNLQRRQNALERIRELSQGQEEATARIRQAYDELGDYERRLRSLRESLGDTCWRRLSEMAGAGGTGSVVVRGVRYKRDEAEPGAVPEREVIGIPVGSIRGVRALNGVTTRALREELRQISLAYHEVGNLTDDSKTTAIESVSARLGRLPQVLQSCQALADQEQTFMTADWSPMLFLARTDSDRFRIGRILLDRMGTPGGRDKAKELIRKVETEIKETYRVDRIEIS